MRSFGFILSAALALSTVAFAQGGPGAEPMRQPGVVTTTDVKGHALSITISGGIDIDSVWRDDTIVAVLNREGANGRAGSNSDSDTFASPRVWLRFDAYMSEHVSACIELDTERLSSALSSNRNPRSLNAVGEWGADANTVVFGGSYRENDDIGVGIQQAYIQVDDFLFERFCARLGIQDFVVDLRGNGHAWMYGFRPDGTEKGFISPVTESFSADGSQYGYFNIGGAAARGIYRSSEEPGGIRFTYAADKNLHIDAWWLKIFETGYDHQDEDFWGLMAKYNIPDSPSTILFHFSDIANDSFSNNVWTVGAGVDYWWDNLEVYGEIAGQWGEYTESSLSIALLNGSDAVDQESWAFYLGGAYHFDSSLKPWIDLQFAYTDGDDGDRDDDDDENEDWVSYEDNDFLMILEDNLYGLDVDSNYWKVQLNGGLSFCLQDPNDFTISATYAYAETVDEVDRVDLVDAAASLDVDDQLGHEVDLKAVWQYSDSLSIDLGVAWLFGADFFTSEDGIGTNGTIDQDMDDTMWMLSTGATVKF